LVEAGNLVKDASIALSTLSPLKVYTRSLDGNRQKMGSQDGRLSRGGARLQFDKSLGVRCEFSRSIFTFRIY
jgi:hypothetical protein